MNINTQKREELLLELEKIHKSGPIVGEDEARREFFIEEELQKLQKTPAQELVEALADLIASMPDDGYREDRTKR